WTTRHKEVTWNFYICTSLERREFCQGDFCITLIDGQITAEAGLCVVIPCSFTISYWFSLKGLVWFKCETVQRCGDSDVILSRNNQKIQPGFKGRVSLLEPNLSQRNCSIIINDLTASDSGSYQLKVNLFTSRGGQDKFQYLQRATGLQSTLTCTAPGLCSGSNDSHITGNITDFKTETLTDVGQPTLFTFFSDLLSVTFTLYRRCVYFCLTDVKEVEITGNTSVREGELLQLTCSVESFPPSLVTWTKMSTKDIKSGSKPDVQNDTLANPENTTEIYLLSGNGQVTFSITKVTAKDSGQYICTANHSNITQMEKVDIEVIYAGQEVEDDQTYDQEVMEAGGAVAEEKAALDPDGGPNDVEYASIDFSVLKRSAAKKRETTETEYAEIKKDVKEQREDQSGGEGEVMEDKEEEMMIGEDEETKNCVPEEEEGEDEAVYSNVKDVMDEI
uniref:Ig-like domain-containing protein n=1 Tax=Labrus bergylta TaxID=56723 RepID=A0A3Q3GLW4_9LABR